MRLRPIWIFFGLSLWHGFHGNKVTLTEVQQSSLEKLMFRYCPKSTSLICAANATGIESSSCCSGCSCHQSCGMRGNCCYEEDDLQKLTEKGVLKCLYPGTSNPDKTNNMPMYRFVVGPPSTGCVIPTGSCISTSEKLLPWKIFNPVFSKSTKQNYVNEDCAKCHGVSDVIKWASLIVVPSFVEMNFDDIIDRILEERPGGFLLHFLHPGDETERSQGLCSTQLTASCLNKTNTFPLPLLELNYQTNFNKMFTGINSSHEDIRAGCLYGPKVQIVLRDKLYRNIFCAFCQLKIPPVERCDPAEERNTDIPFAVLIDRNAIRDIVEDNRQDVNKYAKLACKSSSKDNSCRPLLCPHLQIKTSAGKCRFPSNRWYIHGMSMLLNLTTTVSLEMDTMFSTIPDVKVIDMFSKHTPWPTGWRIAYIGKRSYDLNGNHMIEFYVRLNSNTYESNPTRFMKSLQTALIKPWTIQTQIGNVSLRQQFFPYRYVIAYKWNISRLILKLKWSAFLPGLNTNFTSIDDFSDLYNSSTIEWEVLFHQPFPRKPFTHINKMFFCSQVELRKDEYNFDFGNNVLKILASKKFLFDNEILLKEKNNRFDAKFQVCVEDAAMTIISNDALSTGIGLKVLVISSILILVWRNFVFR